MKAYCINKMEELRTAMIAEGILKENFHDDKLKERLFELQPLEFIPYFLLNSNIRYNDIFFLSNMPYWEKLDYADWKQLLADISNSSLGIYSFFVITYKFMKIDLIPYFKNIEIGDQRKKKLSLIRFFEDPYILQHDDEAERLIEVYSLDRECLVRIRNKLLSQGAQEAQRVEPRKKLGLGLGYTTIEPPSSWREWAADLDD
jgi:hypothetical protein